MTQTGTACSALYDTVNASGYFTVQTAGYYQTRFALFDSNGGRLGLGPLLPYVYRTTGQRVYFGTWSDYLTIPTGAQVRSYAWRWNGTAWQRVAERDLSC